MNDIGASSRNVDLWDGLEYDDTCMYICMHSVFFRSCMSCMLLFCITDLVQWCILLPAYKLFPDLMLYYFGPAGDILNQKLTYFATHSRIMFGVEKTSEM